MSAYRSEQRTSTVGSAIVDAVAELSELASEMRERADNTPEGLQNGETYQTVDSTASELEGVDAPDVPDSLSDIPVTYTEMVQRRRGRGTSRATRCANACAQLSGAADALEEWLQTERTDEQQSEAETLRDECQAIVDTCEGLDFPGMRG